MDKAAQSSRIRFGIRKKMVLSVVLLTALICLISTASGYYQYNNTIRKLYNDNGYVIANIILDHIDHDQIAHYATTWTEDENYAEMSAYLKSVEEASGAAYIYIVTISEDHTMRYIYDSSGLSIGDVDPLSAYFDEAWAAYTKGVKPDNYMVRHSSNYGYLTSSMLPVIDSQGKIAAVLLVDVWMQTIISTLQGYILRMVLISLAVLAVFSAIYWDLMQKIFIRPLMLIRRNVAEFAQNDTKTTIPLSGVRTKDEIQEVAETINRMEDDIVRYIASIQSITAERERISAELSLATRIQADMLPNLFPAFPDRPEFDIYASMDPAKEVGGDFYDFFLVDEDHLCMVIADVSGKGVPAALFMMVSKIILADNAMLGISPAKILENTNAAICANKREEMFVTVWVGILEISTGKLKAANAGHEYPAVRAADGRFELYKDKHGFVVGGMDGVRYKEYELQLEPGAKLFVYTDGVPEATNVENELFGTERMIDALNLDPDARPEQILQNVRTQIDRFVKEAEQFDDLTMLCMEYKGGGNRG